MLHDILFALWFFLPAAMANVSPILVAPIPGLKKWDAPMDFGRTFRGKRIFGSHKTWRGMIVGIIAATGTLALQQYAVGHYDWARDLALSVDYRALPTLIVGPLFAIGALGGDAIESFFKRQRGIGPGHGWFPFDQTDYIIGCAIATAPFIRLSVLQYVWLVVLWLVAHVISGYIGYLLHLKERPI
jgi:CDP-2,3-bis-(O-geranylgeranyl)-sn-glycerol synthase